MDKNWWSKLTKEEQDKYLKEHKKSSLHKTIHLIGVPPVKNAVEPSSTSFTKLMAYFLQCHEKLAGSTEKSEARNWILNSKEFIDKHKLPAKKILDLYHACREGTEKRKESLYEDIGDSIKAKFKKSLAKDLSLDSIQLSIIKDCAHCFSVGSESAFYRVEKNLEHLKDPILNKFYVEEKNSYKQPISQLKKVVNKIVGEPRTDLTLTEATECRENDPETYKKYLELRREARNQYKEALKVIIRSSGNLYVPVDVAKAMLKEKGIEMQWIPSGFKGNIGEDGLYTKTGKKINGVPGGALIMNPEYDPNKDDTYVFKAQIPGGTSQNSYYTEDFIKHQTSKKYETVSKITPKLVEKLKNTWREDIKKGKDLYQALMCELCYQTSIRIGSKGNMTDGKPTYGLSTMLTKQVKFVPEGVRFVFKGKSGVDHNILLKTDSDPFNKITFKYLKDLTKGKEPKEPLFETDRGSSVNGSTVNEYLKGIGFPATFKYFRTLKGTSLARSLLSSSSVPHQENVDKHLKDMYAKIGKVLGHKNAQGKTLWSTSAKNYVSPDLVRGWLAENNLRQPKWLEKVK